jgi:hypothetical protein
MASRFLGTNDVDKIIMTISPPAGPLGVLVASTITALLPANSGYKFPFAIDAKAGGQYLAAKMNVAQNTYTAGADGKVVGNVTHDYTGTFTVTVMQYSITASIFTAMLLAQREGLDYLFDAGAVDLNSGVKYTGNQCRVQGFADRTWGSDAAASLEYTILVAEMIPREISFTGF